MQVDYLILGQGLSGTLLSYYLVKAGASVLVIDNNTSQTATKVASGLINPVTGKRFVSSWIIDELLPVAIDTYQALEQELVTSLISSCRVLNFFKDAAAKNNFNNRLAETDYLKPETEEAQWQKHFDFNNGIGITVPCWLIDLNNLLKGWRKYLSDRNSFLETSFDWKDICVLNDKVIYKDIIAKKIICCEGAAGFQNPYFSKLPYRKNKGEAIIAAIPGLPNNNIYQQKIKIVPWKGDQFWIGSSFEWHFNDEQPSQSFKDAINQELKSWLKLPYEIIDHIAALRPTTTTYKPFAGLHPQHPSVAILNGMGTKGCSLAPYFAKQLSDHLLYNKSLAGEVDVKNYLL